MQDGKTKNEHFRDMLIAAKKEKGIAAEIVLFDSWYASVENLKLIHRMGMQFVTTLKENRLISLSKEGGYIHLEEIEWTEERKQYGVEIKLQEVPFHVQLFKLVAPDGNIDWVITNCPEKISIDLVQKENKVRWNIETMHRELKQLTGVEKCQARKAMPSRVLCKGGQQENMEAEPDQCVWMRGRKYPTSSETNRGKNHEHTKKIHILDGNTQARFVLVGDKEGEL